MGSYRNYRFSLLPSSIDDALQYEEQQQQLHDELDDAASAVAIAMRRQPAYFRSDESASSPLLSSQSQSSPSLLTYSDLIQRSMGLPAYTMRHAIEAADTFTAQYAIVIYDPSLDTFIAYYSHNHQWIAGITNKKLNRSIGTLTWLLRKLFPERFTPNSSEFVMALSGGDYPAIKDRDCIRRRAANQNNNNNSGPCEVQLMQQQKRGGKGTYKQNIVANKAPVLHFGSVFSESTFFPNIIAMPMPGVHLNCFETWFVNRKICHQFLPSYLKPGGLIFGSDVGLSWDDLIPQLIWRGTDFPFLFKNDLEQPRYEMYINNNNNSGETDSSNTIEAITARLRQNYDRITPRWRGVLYTAESEIDARRSNTLPKINIKFSHVAGNSEKKRPALGSVEYQGWESIGFPVAGEYMNGRELARYKYHIDLGGGGGTSWMGTIEKLALPGLLFHHVTPTKDYIHDHIEAWVHYVPVQSDLSDLLEKLEWAESHQEEAQRIAKTATNFMKQLGTSDGFERMFQSNMVKPLRRVIEAYTPLDPADEIHHGSFRQELRRVTKNVGFDWRRPFLQCSGETRFSCKTAGKTVRWGS